MGKVGYTLVVIFLTAWAVSLPIRRRATSRTGQFPPGTVLLGEPVPL